MRYEHCWTQKMGIYLYGSKITLHLKIFFDRVFFRAWSDLEHGKRTGKTQGPFFFFKKK